MLNFAERTGCGAVIVVWSFLSVNDARSISNNRIDVSMKRTGAFLVFAAVIACTHAAGERVGHR
jgi:hypothetical protein